MNSVWIIVFGFILQNMEDLLEHNSDLSAKLMQIGDSIVYKLVQWTKRLPFYLELPVEVSQIRTIHIIQLDAISILDVS